MVCFHTNCLKHLYFWLFLHHFALRRRISCIHSKTVCHTFTYHLCICALFRCNILRTYMAMDGCLCNITVCNSCFIPVGTRNRPMTPERKSSLKKRCLLFCVILTILYIFLFTQPAKIIRNTCHMYVDKFNKYCSRLYFRKN